MAGNFGSQQNPTSIIYIGDGSAAAPSYTFGSDIDTGMFWRSANSFGFSAGGTLTATLNTTGFSIDTGTLQVLNGSAAAPTLTFGADTDTGFYHSATNEVSITTNGVLRWSIDGNGTLYAGTSQGVQHPSGSAATPSINFTGDTDSGWYSAAANEVACALGGAERFRINTANSANDIRFQCYDSSAAAMKQVSRGAADSGGAGFRVLRIPN